jgi:hypothetical protein
MPSDSEMTTGAGVGSLLLLKSSLDVTAFLVDFLPYTWHASCGTAGGVLSGAGVAAIIAGVDRAGKDCTPHHSTNTVEVKERDTCEMAQRRHENALTFRALTCPRARDAMFQRILTLYSPLGTAARVALVVYMMYQMLQRTRLRYSSRSA